MDYRRVYCKIIKKAQSENRLKTSGIYYERHHILPKSLFPLWKNKASNIVLLTIREHLFCHKLLVKIYPSWQMGCALALMLSVERYHCKESDKTLIKKFFNRPEPWNKGLNYFDIFTEDERKRFYCGKDYTKENNPFYGKKHTDESKQKMSEHLKGHTPWNKGKTNIVTSGSRNGRARKCILLNTGEVFDTITEAKKKYPMARHISECCEGKLGSAGKLNGEKLRWAYYNGDKD